MKKIRIFISSPGDVQLERNITRNVINELNVLYAKHVNLEALLWEDFPLSADATFQDGINYFITNEPIDIAVFILWSRLGTPLCTRFKKNDGSPYNSGTEYEFDLMMRLRNESGHPSRILTYVKQTEKLPSVSNFQELKDFMQQQENLESFLKEYFHDEQTHANYAYRPFGDTTSFEQMIRTHITAAIKDIIGDIADVKEWEGNPYVGLSAFEFDQHSIFFGRKHLVYETASKLTTFDDKESFINNLIVLGESGSGKSSFVKAGLLPFYCNKNNSSRQYVIINPSMYGGQMYQGMLDLLLQYMPQLSSHPFIGELRQGINQNSNFEHLSYAIKHQCQDLSLIIYIDQFEELFSDNLITEEERLRVILLLRGLASVAHISLFISMRSDFYNRFSRYEELSQLKDKSVVVDIPVMGLTEIAEIIEEPARKACLKWEIDDKGNSLNNRIIKDAAAIKDLPLIEFALSELYNARNEKDVITKEAYEEIGELRGAIVNYADRCYNELNAQEKRTFEDILGFVITESASHKGSYVRKTSLRSDVEKSELHKSVIEKLLGARLFVSNKDSHGNPTITITHEILLKSWRVVAEWIDREKEFIASSRHYEQLAQYWIANGKKTKDLPKGRSAMLEMEYNHFKNYNRVSADVQQFLDAACKKKSSSGLVWRMVAFVLFVLNIGLLLLIRALDIKVDSELVDQLNIGDILLSNAPIFIVFLYSIIIRIKALPEYKTIKSSVAVWTIATVVVAIYCIVGSSLSDAMLYMGLFVTPFLIYLALEIWELVRRNKWQKRYVPYNLNDDTVNTLQTMSWCGVIILLILSISMAYAIDIGEKQESMNRRAEVADTLFEGLDNIRTRLSYGDNKYINSLRKKYLEENFLEDLADDIPDNRELEYARCLYNLGDAKRALIYLYPHDDLWNHRLHEIFCKYQIGDYEGTEEALVPFADANKYLQVGQKSTSNLIWIAEKLGRFDCAEKLDLFIQDTLPEYKTDPSAVINRGHISLYKGDMDSAMELYRRAISTAKEYGYENLVSQSLNQDLHTFSRFNVFPDTLLVRVGDMAKVGFVPAYVPLSAVDTQASKEVYKSLMGNWVCDVEYDGGNYILGLNVTDDFNYFTYTAYDAEGNDYNKYNAEVRIANINGEWLWDEFHLSDDNNSFGKILEITEDYFILEIIENGNPDDKGKQRRYERVKEEETTSETE